MTAREIASARGERFYDCGKICKRGHSSIRRVITYACPECERLNQSARKAKVGADPVALAERRKKDREYKKERYWRDRHYRECVVERAATRLQKLRDDPIFVERRKQIARKWYEDNIIEAKLSAWRLMNNTPRWLTHTQMGEIRRIYVKAQELSEITSIPHEVDHIVPLRGKAVSGLNVPWNMRILTREENRRKNAKMPEQDDLLGHTTRSIYYVPVDG